MIEIVQIIIYALYFIIFRVVWYDIILPLKRKFMNTVHLKNKNIRKVPIAHASPELTSLLSDRTRSTTLQFTSHGVYLIQEE